MTLPRLGTAIVVALWALPAATALGVLFHVALEHVHVRTDGAVAGEELARVVEHGHAHLGDAAEHDHVVAPSSDPPLRRGSAPVTVPPPQAARVGLPGALAPAASGATPPAVPPPRVRGPELLSLLAVLRI